jgi:hypothetical protein
MNPPKLDTPEFNLDEESAKELRKRSNTKFPILTNFGLSNLNEYFPNNKNFSSQKTKKYSDADKKAADSLIAIQKIRPPKKMKGQGKPVDFIGYEKLKTDMFLFQRDLPSIMKSFEVNFSGKNFFRRGKQNFCSRRCTG